MTNKTVVRQQTGNIRRAVDTSTADGVSEGGDGDRRMKIASSTLNLKLQCNCYFSKTCVAAVLAWHFRIRLPSPSAFAGSNSELDQ